MFSKSVIVNKNQRQMCINKYFVTGNCTTSQACGHAQRSALLRLRVICYEKRNKLSSTWATILETSIIGQKHVSVLHQANKYGVRVITVRDVSNYLSLHTCFVPRLVARLYWYW